MKKTRSPQMSAANGKTVGIDLGDKFSHYCVLDPAGRTVEEGRLRTTRQGFLRTFRRCSSDEDCNRNRRTLGMG